MDYFRQFTKKTCSVSAHRNGLGEEMSNHSLRFCGEVLKSSHELSQNAPQISLSYEPHCEKPGFLHMRKQRRRSALQ